MPKNVPAPTDNQETRSSEGTTSTRRQPSVPAWASAAQPHQVGDLLRGVPEQLVVLGPVHDELRVVVPRRPPPPAPPPPRSRPPPRHPRRHAPRPPWPAPRPRRPAPHRAPPDRAPGRGPRPPHRRARRPRPRPGAAPHRGRPPAAAARRARPGSAPRTRVPRCRRRDTTRATRASRRRRRAGRAPARPSCTPRRDRRGSGGRRRAWLPLSWSKSVDEGSAEAPGRAVTTSRRAFRIRAGVPFRVPARPLGGIHPRPETHPAHPRGHGLPAPRITRISEHCAPSPHPPLFLAAVALDPVQDPQPPKLPPGTQRRA